MIRRPEYSFLISCSLALSLMTGSIPIGMQRHFSYTP